MPDEYDINGPDPNHLHRRGDPDTSRAAARISASLSSVYRRRVWRYAVSCGRRGYTHLELHEAMTALWHSVDPKTTSTYRSRSNDLAKTGAIIDTGERRMNLPSKRQRIVWRALTRNERQGNAEAGVNGGPSPQSAAEEAIADA